MLLMRTIYDKRSGIPTFGSAHPAWFAAQGYVVVSQDCRGRYASEGDFYPYANELTDGYDSVEWAARLPGSDGQVGMMGFSYVGATQLLAAVMAPPSLASITPALHLLPVLRRMDLQRRGVLAGVHRLLGHAARAGDGAAGR